MTRHGPYFTLAARVAAAEARRRRAALKAETKDALEVFVVMGEDPGIYRWQIRQFGSVVVKEANEVFQSIDAARQAGAEALAQGCPNRCRARPSHHSETKNLLDVFVIMEVAGRARRSEVLSKRTIERAGQAYCRAELSPQPEFAPSVDRRTCSDEWCLYLLNLEGGADARPLHSASKARRAFGQAAQGRTASSRVWRTGSDGGPGTRWA